MNRMTTMAGVAALAVMALTATVAAGQQAGGRSLQLDRARLTALLDSACAAFRVHGASAAVVLADGSEWTGTCGIASADTPVEPAHAFEIGSITKTFTAALVLKLVAEGMIGLDDRVQPLLPDVEGLAGVTVRHLLQHTSGLTTSRATRTTSRPCARSSADRGVRARSSSPSGAMRSSRPARRGPTRAPNYHVLGLLAERLTGQPFHVALHERVLVPAGLVRTAVGAAEPVQGPVAHAYLDINGDGTAEDLTALVPNTAFLLAGWASGAILSTALEVAGWMCRVGAGKVVAEPLLAEMLSGRDRGDGMRHGLGVILHERDGIRLLGHKGNSAGFSASAWSAFANGAAVAVPTNEHAIDVTPIAFRLLDEALGRVR